MIWGYAHVCKKQDTNIMSTMLNTGVYKLGVFMEGDYNHGWYLKSILYTIYTVSTKYIVVGLLLFSYYSHTIRLTLLTEK